MYNKYKTTWEKKTTGQIKKELKSWRAYVKKHSGAYAWHGKGITPPGTLPDGDKITALREILKQRGEEE